MSVSLCVLLTRMMCVSCGLNLLGGPTSLVMCSVARLTTAVTQHSTPHDTQHCKWLPRSGCASPALYSYTPDAAQRLRL